MLPAWHIRRPGRATQSSSDVGLEAARVSARIGNRKDSRRHRQPVLTCRGTRILTFYTPCSLGLQCAGYEHRNRQLVIASHHCCNSLLGITLSILDIFNRSLTPRMFWLRSRSQLSRCAHAAAMQSWSSTLSRSTLQVDRDCRISRPFPTRFPARQVICPASNRSDNWMGLQIGPESTDLESMFRFDQLISSLAGPRISLDHELDVSNFSPGVISSCSVVWPAEVIVSFPGYTDGCHHFWKGCSTKQATDTNYHTFIKNENDAFNASLTELLGPTNKAVCGKSFVGWGIAGRGETVEYLGSKPTFTCVLASVDVSDVC